MSLKTTYSDANIVIDDPLSVHYTNTIIQGGWGWTSANLSGSYEQMRECHRYATKSFRYVGMTYDAAMACVADMKAAFSRSIKTSVWDGTVLNGQWNVINGGTIIMADISASHADGDAYDVNIRVTEDDVRYLKLETAFSSSIFSTEQARTYGSNAHGTENETEPTE